jgi:Ca2+-binding RTX toxin-like protein
VEHRANLVLGALALGICIGAADPAAAQTCFGQTPTIVGAGKIKGTPGNDVILGSAFARDQIDGGGGSDVICGLDGDDTIKAKNGTATVDGGPATTASR